MFSRIIMLGFTLTLTGCERELSQSYLLQHPRLIREGIERCQDMGEKTFQQSAECDLFISAAAALMPVVNEQQENPEKFGQKIMIAQFNLVKAKNDWMTAKNKLNELKNKNAPAAEIEQAQEELKVRLETYKEQDKNLKIWLGIAGMSAPE